MIGDPALSGVAGLSLEPVDEVDDVVEPTTGARSDAAPADGDRDMCFTGAGPANQNGIALLGKESAAGEIAHRVSLIGVPQTGSCRDPSRAAAWQW